MKKISVIIPMYNGEAFIGQCICSVTEQTYRNLEILVIDDGSSDNGIGICEELAASDGRIRVLRQENGGVSAARNYGIQAAAGEYVFFLDSDDAIHPCLLEEMSDQMERNQAQLAFCGYRRLDSGQLDAVLEEAFQGGQGTLSEAGAERGVRGVWEKRQARWLMADKAETAKWFHAKYTDVLSGIGGKLIAREAIGDIRFDRSLRNGEDTFFLYQIIKGQVRSLYCLEEWYYYRMHGESVTNSPGTARGKGYFDCSRRIRDGEYESGNADQAMRWEILAVNQIRRSYEALRHERAGKAEGIRGRQGTGSVRESRRTGEIGEAMAELRLIAAAERRHSMFRRVCFSDRMLFVCCFVCYPLYAVLNGLAVWLMKGRSVREKQRAH